MDLISTLHRHGVKHTKDVRLMIEAYRRLMMFGEDKPLEVAWVGLGFPSEYRSNLFRPVSREIPRCLGWYRLSDAGLKAMDGVLNDLPFPDDKQALNNQLF